MGGEYKIFVFIFSGLVVVCSSFFRDFFVVWNVFLWVLRGFVGFEG